MITVQHLVSRMTREAWEGLMRTAAFVPEEKRDWVPQGKARTVHDFVAECAVITDWSFGFFEAYEVPPMDLDAYAKAKAELNTLEQIKVVGDAAIERYCAAVEAVPDAKLTEAKEMPWGNTMTVTDVLFLNYWNIVYHTGQVNYLQMLLGDTEMH